MTPTCIKKHPAYLFAKLNLAELCLQRQEYTKIPAIFDYKLELKLGKDNASRRRKKTTTARLGAPATNTDHPA